MDEVGQSMGRGNHEHGHGGHIHAIVDHLASDDIHKPFVRIGLDQDLMIALHVHADDLVLVTTDRGRTLLGRVGPKDAELKGCGTIRLDRFGRQSLKAHLNEEVRVERAPNEEIERVVLRPGTDVSLAHDLTAHIRSLLIDCRTPVATGAVLYLRFPGSQAGTTYEVAPLKGSSSTSLTRMCRKACSTLRSKTWAGYRPRCAWCVSLCNCRYVTRRFIAISELRRRVA